MATVAFPRRWCAPVVGYGSGRHLQHQRGEGKTIWPKMDWRRRSPKRGGCDGGGSKSVSPDGEVDKRQEGGCEGGGEGSIPGLLAREGGEVGEHSMTSLH
jgi:hypothetical protein